MDTTSVWDSAAMLFKHIQLPPLTNHSVKKLLMRARGVSFKESKKIRPSLMSKFVQSADLH